MFITKDKMIENYLVADAIYTTNYNNTKKKY